MIKEKNKMSIVLPVCRYHFRDNVSSQNSSHVEVCSSSYLIFLIGPYITTLPDLLNTYYLYNINTYIILAILFSWYSTHTQILYDATVLS